MNTKTILSGHEGRIKIAAGLDIAADTITSTLGPKGINVVIEQVGQPPRITKDGVSVAKEIHLSCPFENMGAELLAQIAHKTCNDAGDGTTTASLLAQHIFRGGFKAINTGANPVDLKEGIDIAVKEVTKHIIAHSKPIENQKDLEHIATVSANGDTSIGVLLAEAFTEIGEDGLLTLVEGNSPKTTLEFQNGIQMLMGFHPSMARYCITHPDTETCEYRDCSIFFHESSFPNEEKMQPFLEIIKRTEKKEPTPMLLVASGFNTEITIPMMAINNGRKITKVCPVELPPIEDTPRGRQFRHNFLVDFCVLTGGSLMEREEGQVFSSNVSDKYFGRAESIIVSKHKTVIIGGGGDPEIVEAHKNMIKEEQKAIRAQYNYDQDYDNHLSDRLRNFNGVAIIRAGGTTLTEISERKDRIEDAMHATRASMEEGIVPGGGIALLKAIQSLPKSHRNPDVYAGIKIVENALKAPFSKIIENAGKNEFEIKSKMKRKYESGYDARNDQIVDMVKVGIIDPAKVVRSTLENAASIAGLLLTSNALITYKDRDPNPLSNFKMKM